ncbi:SusD family protein [Chitinophaga terrae (ex Kim and Jung 2007)]|uniref:SusD family protein n=1 Tax=Chitinophaga terrae (ex Kim and Jung 2007) TaxID=408074 RepID=A0A1H3X943_9BACT|nr:RagB/SusD family nutrient uptake outer membrane protein [Chitinophaga terrae (ex Kim and Jung 2007)]GEP89886.1 membrane protein [Chitinophaga terrae (ex Kim and Jung 2007)]SDZ95152.1 SusD family protein [Chitinophaga terrae (ex Kim and Jung 2007)]
MFKLSIYFKIILLSALLLVGCKKLVDVKNPNNRLLKEVVFSTDQAAIGVLNNLFIGISTGLYSGELSSIPLITGLSSDELIIYDFNINQEFTWYYQNNFTPQLFQTNPLIWGNVYSKIYTINDAISGLSEATKLTASVRNQLLGEAKFLRAFCYFYLTNLFGDVALAITPDYKVTGQLSRISQDEIFKQIIDDLLDAQSLLSDKFLDGTLLKETTERVRPTKWAATALLAKVYLYTKKYDLSEQEATKVISNNTLFRLDSLNMTFLKNSNEAIWQIQPTQDIFNTMNGSFFVLSDGIGPEFSKPTYLNNRLVKSFEIGDRRKAVWTGVARDTANGIDYYYPYKYKAYLPIQPSDPLTEYYMMLRLGEQFLIRSEARAEQNKLSDALEDLKKIRNRAWLPDIKPTNKSELLSAIQHERQVELFVEWGDRWFDLRRTGNIDKVMSIVTPEKGNSQWSNYKKYLPIPVSEIRANAHLTQTQGY